MVFFYDVLLPSGLTAISLDKTSKLMDILN